MEDTVPSYSDQEFFEHFRLSRNVVNDISDRFERSTYYHNNTGPFGKIPGLHQVLIFLWYAGHQTSSFRDVGDRFDVTVSSVNRILYRLTMFLSNLSPEIIKWPTAAEKHVSQQHFANKGFPNVIGAIDGCHIKIDRPDNDPDSYINRKGFYSVQMQAVCDHKKKIIDLFLGYPGSVHDSRVFRNSPLNANLERKCQQYFLLGDSGYPLRNNLLTPYKNRGNLTRQQQNYNVKLSKNRYVIEHCFGIVKQKFRQLYHVKLRNIRFIVHFIRAACVLHNIALEDNFEADGDNEQLNMQNHNYMQQDSDEEEENVEAAVVRNRVANTLLN
ncbi:putative nuclease HARBI1 isoform X2 [Diabrotica virgifera virgifera]|uniref:Putative nuclease HARBI1 n=1 Tax=Diabrotica virgifera virgifera TaxID=50390 RepID=A0ABM5KSS9_DIAVI|nr:putative nuclease HARBI1 isoform X2 [Diabrotica virgifera virgifera]